MGNKIVKLGLVLLAITGVTGLILGAVQTITFEPIRAAQLKEKNEALASTLPGASDFKPVEISGQAGSIKEIYEGVNGSERVGYNFTVTPKGYGGPVEFVVGVSNEGRVMDIKILSHTETPGLGAKAATPPFFGQFHEKLAERFEVTKTDVQNDAQIQAISGATITSNAVVGGVNDALSYWRANFADARNEEAM